MTRDRFVSVLHEQPFRPFRMRFGSGATIDVHHPDFVATSPEGGRTAIVVVPDGTEEGATHFVDLSLVEEITFLPDNGERRSAASA